MENFTGKTLFWPCTGPVRDCSVPNVDNRGHLANYHLPHFVHVVIERPLSYIKTIKKYTFVADGDENSGDDKKSKGMKALLENLPELWDDSQYTSEYNMDTYSSSASGQ